MDVEVALRVGREAGDRRTLREQRVHIRAADTILEAGDAVRFEERAPPGGAFCGVAGGIAEVESARLETAVVGLEGKEVLFLFLLRGGRVGGGTAGAVFLVG